MSISQPFLFGIGTIEKLWELSLGKILPRCITYHGDSNEHVCVYTMYDGIA
jgi:hypothetical protein